MAILALFDMAAERRRAADFDGAHDAQLLQWQRVRVTVGLAMLPEDARQLEVGPWHVV